ncbi:zinc-dependent metalloprotease family protein [Natronococcus sp.]|uniref:zinc-dependent metalloprotease family protein n=1 Tax=Natronococcus sp. TaxID=35747 RepID=UPI003A4DFCA9
MNRRTFLTGVGTAAGGAFALDRGVRRVRAPETITVAVYQTDGLTAGFEETGQRRDTGQRLAEAAVRRILEPHFANSFELIDEALTVPQAVTTLPPTLSTFGDEMPAARRSLLNWVEYNRTRSAVDSHILLSRHPEIRSGNGIASPAILPTCCEPIDRYGIAWMAAERSTRAEAAVGETIAHEIGHTIGLQHSHGANIGDAISVMLTSSYARRVGRNLFGEPVSPAASRVSELNDAIADHHLRV